MIDTLIDIVLTNPVMYIGFFLVILASLTNFKVWRANLSISKDMRFPLFMAGIFFVLLGIVVKSPNMLNFNALLGSSSKIKEKDIKKRIDEYFNTVETKNFNQLAPFYAEEIELFYDKSKISIYQLRKIYLDQWKNIKVDNHAIEWNSWKYQKDHYDNHIITLRLTYYTTLKTKTEEEPPQKRELEIKMDKELKIYSIKNQLNNTQVEDKKKP
ncbi:MAG: hypothetical protein EAZ55_06090 [Cytophagales bacterium]|nr:MAG: hypothetical protein EAZ55_06090 [Cytophagales bacterium]